MIFGLLAFCVSSLCFGQIITAQSIGHIPTEAALTNNIAYGPSCSSLSDTLIPETGTVFKGGSFKVTSYSSGTPTGLTVQSDDLAVEGALTVTGSMPFLGVVSLEGPLPAVGQGAVTYNCGNGDIGIVSEGIHEEAIGVPTGMTGLGYNGVVNGRSVPVY